MNRAAPRANFMFSLYSAMGAPRSLRHLAVQLRQLGSPISVQTLKRWSVEFGWQERLREVDRRSSERQVETLAVESAAMLRRHAELARAVQAAGGQGLQGLLSDPGRLANLTAVDIARLVELGLKAEAAATRQSADRRELATGFANLLTHEIVDAFTSVNDQVDPERRARLFAERVDNLIDTFMTTEG